MQKKSKYILPLLMLTLLAGCDKTNETPSQIPSEVPSDTAVTPSDKPSATVKPSVAPKIELTDARLKNMPIVFLLKKQNMRKSKTAILLTA